MGAIGSAFKFVGGVTIGLGIGAAVAVILAPQSGEETKKQLQERWEKALSVGREVASAREKQLRQAYTNDVSKAGNKKSEDKKIDEMKKIEDKKIAEMKKVEDKKIDEMKKIEDKKIDEVKKVEDKKIDEMKKIEDKKIDEMKKIEDKKAN